MSARPKSPVVERMDDLQRLLTPRLKVLGFRRQGRTYNRFVERDMAQVIAFQTGPFEVSGGAYGNISYYGKATVNLGVYIKECHQRSNLGHEPRAISDAHCMLRTRLSQIEHGEDLWFDLSQSADEIFDELWPSLIGLAIPMLDRWRSRDEFINYTMSDLGRREGFLFPAARLDVVAIHLARDDRASAQRTLDDYLCGLKRDTPHGRYVAELATRLGLDV